MKRLHRNLLAVGVAVLLMALFAGPVTAQETFVPQTIAPQTIEDANQLAQYQAQVGDMQMLPADTVSGEVADLNQLAQHQERLAANIGVVTLYEAVPWYVEYNQVCDCMELAEYMNRVVDINVPPSNLYVRST